MGAAETMEGNMRLLAYFELSRYTKPQLWDLYRHMLAALPGLPEGSVDRANAMLTYSTSACSLRGATTRRADRKPLTRGDLLRQVDLAKQMHPRMSGEGGELTGSPPDPMR